MIKSVCFLTTMKCNAVCTYCQCGPDRQEMLTFQDMKSYIDKAVSFGTVGLIVFSGGEPTLLGDDLYQAIAYATEKKMLTRIVTNGWWGRKNPKSVVRRLLDSGLSEINISTDDLHQEWIPLEDVKKAFLACYELGLKCLIAHKGSANPKITPDFLKQYFGMDLINYKEGTKYTDEESLRLISTGIIVPVGRAPQGKAIELIYGKSTRSCKSILNDIVIDARHQLKPCCGIVSKSIPEFNLGDLRDSELIDVIKEANEDTILNYLALEGPRALLDFIQSKKDINIKKKFVNMCDVCNSVMTNQEARTVMRENIDELRNRASLHRAFFEQIRNNKEIVTQYM